MDQRERLNDFQEGLRLQIRAALLEVFTAMPVQVVSFDPDKMVATVQPLIQAVRPAIDGSTTLEAITLLINLPVIFPGGGGFTMTFPISPGDEGLAVFSYRSIDNWWLAGGLQQQLEPRILSADDGFLLIGPRSLPRVLSDVSIEAVELRSDDGATVISIGPDGAVGITAPLPGGLTITGNVVIDGNLHVNGVISHTP